jgi:nitroimidazol reductase NimA-like FMN-containing flavoprotein (pyridoxamine 5'-phosphate oxidase superfamily)
MSLQSSSSLDAEKLISTFLADNYSGVIATADSAANPHGAVVYYLPDPDYSLYFVTKEETQKYKNIEQNKQVAFVIYNEETQTSLQIFGQVVIVDDMERKAEAIKNMTNTSLSRSNTLLPPAYKLDAGEYAVVQLVPQVMKMAIYARSDADEDLYEELIFG